VPERGPQGVDWGYRRRKPAGSQGGPIALGTSLRTAKERFRKAIKTTSSGPEVEKIQKKLFTNTGGQESEVSR